MKKYNKIFFKLSFFFNLMIIYRPATTKGDNAKKAIPVEKPTEIALSLYQN
jgi:hypothetical protein